MFRKTINFIDHLLGRITMYWLLLCYLIILVFVASILGYFGAIPYSPFSIVFSAVVITVICWATNNIFAYIFEASTNVESVFITALILALLISPPPLTNLSSTIPFLFWASVWAMASKFILAIGKKHIFNPAAFAVALTAITINQSASWWIGNIYMLPFVLVGGLLVTRKILRFDLVLSFLSVALITIAIGALFTGFNPIFTIYKTFVDSPLFFFAFIMLTEPLTTPPTRGLRMLYGAFVGVLFSPVIHLGSIYSTPELALLIGNIFSYLVSPKAKLILTLKEKMNVGPGLYDFVFESDRRLKFRPGQYLEWTLGHSWPDSRGNRRYFTIASAPTEKEIRLGVKFSSEPSSFKKKLLSMKPGDRIVASQLAGDFVLPDDKSRKLVLIAGGIGVTPFRSMIKYLLDKNEKRNVALFYSAKTPSEIVYRDIFDKAGQIGLKPIYTVTDRKDLPAGWDGSVGFVNPEMIRREVPDYMERTFYLSGPHSMVVAFENSLIEMGLARDHIKKDFFPGFA